MAVFASVPMLAGAQAATAATTSPTYLDPTFGSAGAVTQPASSQGTGVAIVPSGVPDTADIGDIVVSASGGTTPTFQVDRFTPAGTADATFGNAGVVSAFPGQANAVTVVPSGTNAGDVVVAGVDSSDPSTCGGQQPVVAEYTPAGAPVTTFGTNGVLDMCPSGDFIGAFNGVALDASNNIVVAGQIVSPTGTLETLVARVTPAGAPDPNFGTAGFVVEPVGSGPTTGSANSAAAAVAVSPSGNNDIITAGYSYGSAGVTSLTVAAFTPAGLLDPSFSCPTGAVKCTSPTPGVVTSKTPGSIAYAVTVLPDGTITAAGAAQAGSGNTSLLAQYSATGGPSTGFGTSGEVSGISAITGTNELHAVTYQASDNVLVAAGTALSGSSQEMIVTQYDATTGAANVSFGSRGLVQYGSSGAGAAGVADQADGKPVAVGVAPVVNSAPVLGVIRLLEPLVFSGVAPTRVCDTRSQAASGINDSCTGHTLRAGVPLVVPLPTVPAGTEAIVANVTVTNPSTAGFLTVYPTGQPVPASSNLNYTTGQTVANLVTVAMGSSRGQPAISVVDGQGTPSVDVIIDVEGYDVTAGVSPAGGFNPLTPARVADTRCSGASPPPFCSGEHLPAINHSDGTIGPLGQDTVHVTGVGGVPASGVAAVVVNVTAVAPSSAGYLTVAPGGSIPPGTTPASSTLNFAAHEVLANKVIVPVPSSGPSAGTITVFNHAGNTDVVLDVDGWYSSATSAALGAALTPVVPVRLADTRCGVNPPPAFCASEGLPSVNAGDRAPAGGQAIKVGIAGTGSVPASIDAAVLDVVDVAPTASNYLTVYPTGAAVPPTSDVNWDPANTFNVVPGAAYAITGTGGAVNVYNGAPTDSRTDIVADLFGYYTVRGAS